jgi:hypothetical protein
MWAAAVGTALVRPDEEGKTWITTVCNISPIVNIAASALRYAALLVILPRLRSSLALIFFCFVRYPMVIKLQKHFTWSKTILDRQNTATIALLFRTE